MTARGECNCGAVAFEISAELRDVIVCHCSICRRATGGSGIAVVIVGNEAFRWTRGENRVSTWKKPDGDWQLGFCSQCGSPMPGRTDESKMFVPVGLISAGGENLDVAHHIWVGSRASWDVIGDAGKRHENGYVPDGV